MKPAIELNNAVVYLGSNLDVLPNLPDNSVDSIVTDPPYELGFMGKSWDSTGIAYNVDLWAECLRVLKPGGHLLAFSGSRTYHRMAVAIEDAGFEIRDQMQWIYGSGFPKSLDISKAIDKASGFQGEVIGTETVDVGMQGGSMHAGRETKLAEREIKALSPEAEQWNGWGTALKPAHEPIVMARKPLIGTVAANVLEWGTGGLNIDASRISTTDRFGGGAKGSSGFAANYDAEGWTSGNELGRWPANVMFDEAAAEILDGQNDASRFFYVAKASKRDRNEGLDGLEATQANFANNTRLHNNGDGTPRNKEATTKNFHPTVKPTELMRYLIKLVTPPNGTVLDPFTGSGSTGKAAIMDGFNFIGIELTEEYLPIIEGRLTHAQQATEEQTEETLF